MDSYLTRYGILSHIGEYSLYSSGVLKECMLTDKEVLTTEYGDLIPQYEYEENRRKYIYSLAFYEGGSLKKIALNDKTAITTPIGVKEVELITFYQSGKLKRLFPLNGRISAYWDESEEYKLAVSDTVEIPGQTIRAKIMAYSFYESGYLKDLTFWPKEVFKLKSPIGEVRVRIGVAFYEDGNIKSLEPAFPVAVPTPIGEIKAFDLNANGITGDKNSLVFNKDGKVEELITSGMKITVQNKKDGNMVTYSPEQDLDSDGLEICFHTLKITFLNNTVCFNNQITYQLLENSFQVEPYYRKVPGMCTDCSACGQCSG